MCKRILSLLLTLLLLCGSAGAENNVYDLIDRALYVILLRTEAGDIPLGSGVLFMDQQTLLTAEGCAVQGTLCAVGGDGEHLVTEIRPAGDSGAVLLQLDRPASAQPLVLSDYQTPAMSYVFGADGHGGRQFLPLYQILYGMYRGQENLVLSSEEGLMPGAVAVDGKSAVAGVVVTQQAEGAGMYTALDASVIGRALDGAGTSVICPVKCKWNGGILTLTWTDRKREGGLYAVSFNGMENYYYTTYEAEASERTLEIIVPPGHTYEMQVQWVEKAEDFMPAWEETFFYTVPEQPLTQYAFTQEGYLISVPAGQQVTELLEPMSDVTADALLDDSRDVYLQLINRYDVHQDTEIAMSAELIAPDGQFYFTEHMYLLSPKREAEDMLSLPLDEMLADCVMFSDGAMLPGQYRVRCSIEGKIAGEYAFTLE